MTSSGLVTLAFDTYGEGVNPSTDSANIVSTIFSSNVPQCTISSIILASDQEGTPVSNAIISIVDDFLVVDLSEVSNSST